jgi:hypothetical protein
LAFEARPLGRAPATGLALAAAQNRQRFVAAPRSRHVVAGVAQVLERELANQHFILDQQDLGHSVSFLSCDGAA